MPVEAASTLKIRLFGPFEALLNGAALLGLNEHRKGVQLLALLSLYPNTALGNEWVATLLWPEMGDISNLRHTVAIVRNALGPYGERLTARAGTLFLDLAGADVDVIAFANAWKNRESDLAELERAVDLVNGPLLQDCYDEWVVTARNGFAGKYLEALQLLADHAVKNAHFPAARRFLRRLVLAGDLAEALHSRLLTALLKGRHYVEAKQFYEQYRDLLRTDHGLLPPRVMTELYGQIPCISPDFVAEYEPSLMELEPVGGAMPLTAKFYLERSTDSIFHAAVARRDGIILIEGPRQVGKTSLLARGLEQARQAGAQALITDFQKLSPDDTKSSESFFLSLARWIYRRLKPSVAPEANWDALLAANVNFETYLRDEILDKTTLPIVWGIDEADRIFDCGYRSSVFGLFRSWYNERSLDPGGPWERLTLILTYSTEAHLLIANLNQSPFNVGTKVSLQDFTLEQVSELNQRYDSPLHSEEEAARLFALIGGHPYLVRRSLHEMKTRGLDVAAVEAEADRIDGIFSDHLDRMRMAVTHDADLTNTVRGILRGDSRPTQESFSRLRSAGVVAGASLEEARLRCRLYEKYLTRHLL